MMANMREVRRALRGVAGLLLPALLVACGGGGGGAEPPPPSCQPVKIEPYPRTQAQSAPKLAPVPARVAASRIDLQPLPKSQASAAAAAPGSPRRIGVGRSVSQTAGTAEVGALLSWQPLPGGAHAAALAFHSPGATGLRIGLLVQQLPAEAVVRAYGAEGAPGWTLAGREILGTLAQNAQAGERGEAARLYWLPTVQGDVATLQIELPPGTAVSAVQVAVPRLSHLFEDPRSGERQRLKATGIGQSGACNIDVMCSAEAQQESPSVAMMEFVSGADAFVCTGTLMADSQASRIPYFLTGNHCISNQAEASTLITYWFFRAAACGAPEIDPAFTTRAGGATLLHANAATDVSFMRLNAEPPAAAVHAGSWSGRPGLGTGLLGVHHPQGDLQKFSLGAVDSFGSCGLTCSAGQVEGNFLVVRWTAGTTEQGSSGSAGWATLDGRRYVIGHLYAGSASCQNPTGRDFYGRFDLAYPAIKQWLHPAPAPGDC